MGIFDWAEAVGFLIALGIVGGCSIILPMVTDRTTCVASENGNVFYQGSAYNINCKSMGDSTQCSIGQGGFLYWLPSSHKVGKNIVIDCK